jgi:hypothetical protein
MRRIVAVFAGLALAVSLSAQKETPKAESLFSEIDGICRDLETITGLKFKQKVPSSVYSKDELRKFLSTRIDKVMKPSDVKAESLILKMLGLVPADYDLRGQTVDLLTEQAAAFYDYQKKRLYLMEGDTGESALMALAHELGHALADQNFHLEKYIKQNNESDDAATARMAVMEGQASWLMSAYLHQRAGLSPDVPKPILDAMAGSFDQDAGQYPVYAQSPVYVRESLIFPYKAGMLFQDAVFRKMGKEGFAEVFRRAPVSTQQILHPERYLDRIAPQLPDLPRLESPKQYRKLAEGTLGEFDYRVLMTQYGSPESAKELAGKLLGSQFALWEHKKDGNPVLLWASKWESREQARAFFDFYQQALLRKAKKPEPGKQDGESAVGRNEYGFYRVTLSGDTVTSLEGVKTSLN